MPVRSVGVRFELGFEVVDVRLSYQLLVTKRDKTHGLTSPDEF
jgi:hypothetical protein